jgi:hypothetical protein
MTLPKAVEEKLEEVLEEWLVNFDATAEVECDFLKEVGIEPTLETLLSYTVGVADAFVGGFIHCLYDRGMTREEDDELVELIKRKLPELERKFNAFLSEKEL